MENNQNRTSLLNWIMLAVVLAFLLMYIAGPLLRHSHRDTEIISSVNNARNLGLALLEFEQEYGRFPDASTAEKVREKADKPLNFSFASSNDYLFQLIAAKIVPDDMLFYAKTAYTHRPGKQRDQGEKSLDPGEVGFGYLMNGKEGLSTHGNPARPTLCAPLDTNGKTVSNRLFDPEIHNSKAVILRLDGSVQAPPIFRKTKTVMLGAGKSLLDTGEDTVWGSDTTPVIVPPLPSR